MIFGTSLTEIVLYSSAQISLYIQLYASIISLKSINMCFWSILEFEIMI